MLALLVALAVVAGCATGASVQASDARTTTTVDVPIAAGATAEAPEATTTTEASPTIEAPEATTTTEAPEATTTTEASPTIEAPEATTTTEAPESTTTTEAPEATTTTEAPEATTTTEVPEATTTTEVPEATTTTEAPESTTTEAPPTTAPPTETPEPEVVLAEGSVGSRTKAVQEALADQRYDPGEADGRFGSSTTMAVWAFQALHGREKDGVVNAELELMILSKPEQPMLRPELGPTHTEVDLSRQVMIVWRDGAPALITHVSSGSEVPYCEATRNGENCGDAVTPLGVYQYERRIDGWRDAPLGRLYKPVYFHGGIAVHGAPSVPDHPASHGCVRIPMDIAEYFPGLVADGETIEVFRS